MEPEEKRLLEETAELTRDNHKILKKLRRAQIIGRTIRILYWVIIIGITFGAYYFIQPYIDQFVNVYSGLRSGVESVQNVSDKLPDLSGLPDALQGLGGLLP